MSRIRTARTVATLLAGGVLAAAVLTAGQPAASDVAIPVADAAPTTEMTNVPLTGSAGEPRPGTTSGKAEREIRVERNATGAFRAVSLSWEKGVRLDHGAHATARFHRNGEWTAWQDIPLGGDQDSGEAKRTGSGVFFSDTSDGAQLRLTTEKGELPRNLRLSLINPDKKPEASGSKGTQRLTMKPAAAVGTAGASAADRLEPVVHTRADWGADESKADPGLKGMDTVRAMVVHHTVNGNAYRPEDVPSLMRAIYTDKIENEGYGDFPYHFVVDRFGGIWEGRRGSIAASPSASPKAILGGHAAGYNTGTLGVATLGNFEPTEEGSAKPEPDMLNGVRDILAWKGAQYQLDPKGKAVLDFAGQKPKTVDVVSGHRDVYATLCPGEDLYALLPALRQQVADRMEQAQEPAGTAPAEPRAQR
ncbi:N-acetylmuramoyl-L-alanine amidase [Streptomyces celluloflavus]|uniref:N-acetylmuramoyl-L-alanine amidase n=1 Tax=Streptomyces celluloflavus TaxID=58344 RepID=UPI0036BD7E53